MLVPQNFLFLNTFFLATNLTTNNTISENNTKLGESISESKCDEMFGCFNITDVWQENRPIVLMPLNSTIINPRFYLYRHENGDNYQRIFLNDTSSLYRTSFQGDKKVYVITHGYLERGSKPWIITMAKELLKYDKDANVIVTDWHGGSGPPYTQAVANIRLVGRAVAKLLKLLSDEFNVNIEDCHLIGHSLGAHAFGYAGQALKDLWGIRLGRITGMDPAEPHFANTNPLVRLDPTDAIFVDVIHTDAAPFLSGGLGIKEKIGHLDFYPNGGDLQPGCEKNVFKAIGALQDDEGDIFKAVQEGLRRVLGCNHIRSYELFTESINSKCPLLAVECNSWQEFNAGHCFKCPRNIHYETTPTCSRIGLHAEKTPGREYVQLYSKTGAKYPFCGHHYKIDIKISSSNTSFLHGGETGEFHFTFVSKDGNQSFSTNFFLDKIMIYKPNTTHTDLILGEALNDVETIKVEWKYMSSILNTFSFISMSRIYIDYIKVSILETRERLYYCKYGQQMLGRKPIIFTKSDIVC